MLTAKVFPDVLITVGWNEHTISLAPAPTQGAFRMSISFGGKPPIITGERSMAVEMTSMQKFTVTVEPRDPRGNPALVQGAVAWTVDPEGIVDIIPSSPDGISAEVIAVGPVGACVVTATADADIGDDVATISGALDVTVRAAQAATLAMLPSEPVEQSAA